jgi:hypothetical protein
MTDREFLELAAKAAGWKSWDWLAGDEVLNVYDAEGRHELFNPLTDDGDALRLAVKLNINLILMQWRTEASIEDLMIDIVEPVVNGDPAAATCRAITRAAAEIGRNMP